MITLTMTLVATVLVMVLAVVLGVGMGRSRRTDTIIRPFLDAFQTIPPFVYLVPALALFGVGRFTAIVAALAYAVPIATKLVADGIRGVSPTTVEAARASGSTTWQMITKVQLPMARESLVLATNQGLLYVLSMVVIGGLVGGGSLGYIVVSGFSAGPAVRQGPRRRHRDHRPRRDARPDRAGTRRTSRPLGSHHRRLRGWTAKQSKRRTTWLRGLTRGRTRLVAIAASVGLGLAGLAGCGRRRHQGRRHGSGRRQGLRRPAIAVNPWTGLRRQRPRHRLRRQDQARLQRHLPGRQGGGRLAGHGQRLHRHDRRELGPRRPVKKYIDEQKTVEDAGPTGSEGLIGWFVPQWMTEKYPDITDWKNLNKYADLFKTSESGGKGQLLDGDPSYVTNDEALVKNLKLNYKVVVGGSEAALLQASATREKNKTPLLGVLLHAAVVRRRRGSRAHSGVKDPVKLAHVKLPPYKEGCDADPPRSTATTRRTT